MGELPSRQCLPLLRSKSRGPIRGQLRPKTRGPKSLPNVPAEFRDFVLPVLPRVENDRPRLRGGLGFSSE
jgi:hypothetical protein